MEQPTATLEEVFAAVPTWVEKIAGWAPEELTAACEDMADLIAGGADLLWYRTAKPRRRRTSATQDQPDDPTLAEVAEALAKGLAALALAPGGVTALGRHWCTASHQDCPGPGGGMEMRVPGQAASGAVYTPRSLAEQVTEGALEPLVYAPGPLQTGDRAKWRLKSSADIVALNVGDISVGAGVFPLAAVRYLADRVVEAWATEGVDGDLLTARRAVLRCVHGADINAPAVQLAKVALWLVTFDREQPHLLLDRQFTVGDSLLGITNLQQLAWMHLEAERGKDLHAGDPTLVAYPRHVATCSTVATRHLMKMKQRQPGSVETLIVQTATDLITEIGGQFADLVTGAYLAGSTGSTDNARGRSRDARCMEAARLAAATWVPPAPVDWSPVELAMPVVYAAQQAVAGTLDDPDPVWHIADPTTDHLTDGAFLSSAPSRTWFMCARLADVADVVCTRRTPDEVCAECRDAVAHINALLGSYLRHAAEGLRAVFAAQGT